MKLNSFFYFIADAFKSLKRNLTISIASAATVLTTLVVLGAFLLTAINVNLGVQDVQNKVEIKVFLNNDITTVQQEAVQTKIKAIAGVKAVAYETKAQALVNFKDQFADDKEILEGYNETNNPLPNSFIVKLDQPIVADTVEKSLTPDGKLMAGVNQIGNDQEMIQTITSFANTVKWVGLILFVVLIGVSLFLIINTIKITVYSRRREVGIMKFVGATDWFIRWPFVIEGIVIGLVGSILSVALIYGVYSWIFRSAIQGGGFYAAEFIHPSYILTTMSWQFIGAGILIGAIGSVIALRKFLDV
ncbi:permease-like cell division protein FtsX [uncultured Clostridium sp.]|jgi:cell division transport system permease protein|uniref:permease-like cell division protein FtsX n=1 Tax=uncultured Clostridium sp. TaxID=59620 RepID=UPI002626131A|nr:permease-like cell division protein FtsX [uncultured Clostridium sp.]